MGLNVLDAAFKKYGFGKYAYGTDKNKMQVVCNHLVMNALKDSGYVIKPFATNHGSTNSKGEIDTWFLYTQSDERNGDGAQF